MTGKKLIAMGYEPDVWFSEAIAYLSNKDILEHELREYLDKLVEKHKKIPLVKKTPPLYVNLLEGENFAKENYAKVIRDMKELLRTPFIEEAAIMPDSCPTGSIPVGAVVKSKKMFPVFHGADICCSMYMTEFKSNLNPSEILDIAYKSTHFGRGRRSNSKHRDYLTVFCNIVKDIPFFNKKALKLAKQQFATQGDGNHFLFLGIRKSTGNYCLVTHHGSRGMGAQLFREANKAAKKHTNKVCPDAKYHWLSDKDAELYKQALFFVKQWTKKSHEIIHKEIQYKIGSTFVTYLFNPHNFIFTEGDCHYHAKGATPVSDKLSIIPMNMESPILLVRGKDNGHNLGFAPHGAGRLLSRTAYRKLVGDEIPKVNVDARFFHKPDITEFPGAYKSAKQVISEIEYFNLCEIVDQIEPLGTIMCGHQSGKR